MNKLIIFILSITSFIFAEYSVGDIISQEHLDMSFDVCYGDYTSDQLSFSDFNTGNKVIWLNMSASW